MQSANFDDEIWNEYQWERHINEIEEKSDQLKEFINATWGEEMPSWARLMKECRSEMDAIDAYIEEELLYEEAYFPDDDDDLEMEDDDDDDDILFNNEYDEDEEFYDEDMDDESIEDDEEGEEWKTKSEAFAMSDFGSIDSLPVYITARNIGAHLLKFTDHYPHTMSNRGLVQFISATLQISCKLAAGYSFGFEKDVLGANIAYAKKALAYANKSLSLLQNMKKGRSLFIREEYMQLHEWLFDLRNDIGLYVQDLRSKFYYGL